MITLDVEEIHHEPTPRRSRKVYYHSSDTEPGKFHPMIRLQGHYLEEKGFKVGDRIAVYLEYGRITITKEQHQSAGASHGKRKIL